MRGPPGEEGAVPGWGEEGACSRLLEPGASRLSWELARGEAAAGGLGEPSRGGVPEPLCSGGLVPRLDGFLLQPLKGHRRQRPPAGRIGRVRGQQQ